MVFLGYLFYLIAIIVAIIGIIMLYDQSMLGGIGQRIYNIITDLKEKVNDKTGVGLNDKTFIGVATGIIVAIVFWIGGIFLSMGVGNQAEEAMDMEHFKDQAQKQQQMYENAQDQMQQRGPTN